MAGPSRSGPRRWPGAPSRGHEIELSAEDLADLEAEPRATLNRLLFPGPAKDLAESRERYSDLSVLPTQAFLYGLGYDEEHDVYLDEGVRLILGLESISQPDDRGFRTVMCTINGQLRPLSVRDRSVSSDAPAQERADPGRPGHIGAPFDGVVSPLKAAGDTVEAGEVVATIEAMKMEASITSPIAGTVERVALDGPRTVEGGDLVVVVSSG